MCKSNVLTSSCCLQADQENFSSDLSERAEVGSFPLGEKAGLLEGWLDIPSADGGATENDGGWT